MLSMVAPFSYYLQTPMDIDIVPRWSLSADGLLALLFVFPKVSESLGFLILPR